MKWHRGASKFRKQCVACGDTSAPITKEHFFPVWLIERTQTHAEGIAWGGKDNVPSLSATVLLCKRCNSDFGREIESPTAKVFDDLEACAVARMVRSAAVHARIPYAGTGHCRAARMPQSTVSAVLARNGLGPQAALEPPRPVNRYERRQAGELLHLDIKKLGRFRRPGHRVTGSRVGRNHDVGWEFVHVAVDDFSRLAYAEILPDERGGTCAAFTRRACVWFAKQGIAIQALLTDNGTGYRSHRFRNACQRLRLRHHRTRPYTPRTNGKAERFIQSMLREWAYVRVYRSSDARAKNLPRWIRHYNQERPHASLGYLPPISRRPVREQRP